MQIRISNLHPSPFTKYLLTVLVCKGTSVHLTMLQKLAIWLLLPPMLLNGLWMVCNPPGVVDSPAETEESADCIRICAALEAQLGRICIIWPGDTKPSLTIIDFGAAILPSEILLQPVAIDERLERDLPVLHRSPSLSNPTPPPRA